MITSFMFVASVKHLQMLNTSLVLQAACSLALYLYFLYLHPILTLSPSTLSLSGSSSTVPYLASAKYITLANDGLWINIRFPDLMDVKMFSYGSII